MNLTTLTLDELQSERDLAVYELSGYGADDTSMAGYQRLVAWLERLDAELVARGAVAAPASAGTTKKVCPARPGETVAQRDRRLGQQAAANRIRVRDNGDGTYRVPSQRRGPDGQPVEHYTVTPGAARACTCEASRWHPDRTCAHVAQVLKHVARKAAQVARAQAVARVWVGWPRCECGAYRTWSASAGAWTCIPCTPAPARVYPTCPRCGCSDAAVFPFVCWHCGHQPVRRVETPVAA